MSSPKPLRIFTSAIVTKLWFCLADFRGNFTKKEHVKDQNSSRQNKKHNRQGAGTSFEPWSNSNKTCQRGLRGNTSTSQGWRCGRQKLCQVTERSRFFLLSSPWPFAIRLVLKSTFLSFVIQSNERGRGVKDRVVDRSGRLDSSDEGFRTDTNRIWHLSQTLSITALPWRITHKRHKTACTSALVVAHMLSHLSAVVHLWLAT